MLLTKFKNKLEIAGKYLKYFDYKYKTIYSNLKLICIYRTEPVLYRGLLLTWSGYEDTAGGVERVVPSHCGQRVCPAGYTGTRCQQLEVDKVYKLIN